MKKGVVNMYDEYNQDKRTSAFLDISQDCDIASVSANGDTPVPLDLEFNAKRITPGLAAEARI